jgi:hypothetical protein
VSGNIVISCNDQAGGTAKRVLFLIKKRFPMVGEKPDMWRFGTVFRRPDVTV